MLLTRDGHDVTVLERDPAAPPAAEHAQTAWDGWQRPGVNQFQLPHFMLPRWWALVRAELPEETLNPAPSTPSSARHGGEAPAAAYGKAFALSNRPTRMRVAPFTSR